jgi:hypothetical protein
MRRVAREENDDISTSIEKIADTRLPLEERRKWALGLSQRRDIRHEPEFKNLRPIFGYLAKLLKRIEVAEEEIKILIGLARYIENEALKLYFMVLFTELVKRIEMDKEKVSVLINLARRRMTEVRFLYSFMVRFRAKYRTAILKGRKPECRFDMFNDTYLEFAKKSNFVRGSPHFRIICYLAAMSISLI